MAKIIKDQIHFENSPELVQNDLFHKVGDLVWCGADFLVFAEIKKIRYDKSIFRSRYLVENSQSTFWTSFVQGLSFDSKSLSSPKVTDIETRLANDYSNMMGYDL